MSLVHVDLSLLGLENASNIYISSCATVNYIRQTLEDTFGLPADHYYLVYEGKRINNDSIIQGNVQVVPRLCGGKGGFGSMLRAIGAQIEKTTNREACRDLSGRRLRDINEEQRLKKWISQQAEREREAEESRKRKLEKLSAEPKHDFKDEKYEAERTELTEKLYDSVEQGLKASSSGVKRTLDAPVSQKKKKKLHYFDDEFSSSEESGSESEPKLNIQVTSEEDSSNTGDASVNSKNLLVDQVKNNESDVSPSNDENLGEEKK